MHVQNHHFVHIHLQNAFFYTLACILLSDLDRPACTSGVAFPYQSNNENEKHIFDFAHLQDAQHCIYIYTYAHIAYLKSDIYIYIYTRIYIYIRVYIYI